MDDHRIGLLPSSNDRLLLIPTTDDVEIPDETPPLPPSSSPPVTSSPPSPPLATSPPPSPPPVPTGFWRSLNRGQVFTVVTCCLANFVIGAFYALMAPFFPVEAGKKGVSPIVVGFIIGTFQGTIGLSSLVFGSLITQIGAKFMYVTGVMFGGCTIILFGFLDGCPDGVVYIIMCFLVRFCEALGAGAFYTANFAIIANTFPQNVASMVGNIELFHGLGLMAGPPIGGVLFQLGGFKLPFICLGALAVLIALIGAIILPQQQLRPREKEGSIFALLKIPIIPIVGFCLICGTAAMGFMDTTLAIFLDEKFNLPPIKVGAIFLVSACFYAFSAPIWGWISDKRPGSSRHLICLSYVIAGLSLFFVGPAPFFHIPSLLWLLIISLALVGLGLSCMVISFAVLAQAAIEDGYPDSLATYGLVAGIFNCFFSTGACLGPPLGGFLQDQLTFEVAAVIIGSSELFGALLLLLFILGTRYLHRAPSADHQETPDDESEQGAINEASPFLQTFLGPPTLS